MNLNDLRTSAMVDQSGMTGLEKAILQTNSPIFDEVDVLAYQQKARLKMARKLWLREFLLYEILLLTAFGASASASWFSFSSPQIGPKFSCAMGLVMAWLAIAAACKSVQCVMHFWVDRPPEDLYWASWQSGNYETYRGAHGVPVAIDSRVQAIRSCCSLPVEFTVQWLGPDPFLFAWDSESDSAYCVGVWDEEGFR